MRIRLWKEFRVLMPYLIGLLALNIAVWFLSSWALDEWVNPTYDTRNIHWIGNTIVLCVFAQLLIFHLAAVNLFSHEFTYMTMGRLLAQPVSRNLLWWEKAAAFLITVAVILAVNALVCVAMMGQITRLGTHLYFWGDKNVLLEVGLLFAACAAALALASGPLMALLIRQTRTAFLASLVLPVLILTIFSYLDYTLIQAIFGTAFSDWANAYFHRTLGEFNLMILFTIPWFLVVFPLGWLKFKRLEV